MNNPYEIVLTEETPTQSRIRNYQTLARNLKRDYCVVNLTVRHPDCESRLITEKLQLHPDYVVESGGSIYKDARFGIKSDVCVWSYDYDCVGHELESADLVQRLLNDFFGKRPTLSELREDGAQISVNLTFVLHSTVSYLNLPPELLMQLARMGALLTVKTIWPRHGDDADLEDVDSEDSDLEDRL